MSALKVTGKSLKEQQIVMLGAGSAGIGVADFLKAAMREEGLSEKEAASVSGSSMPPDCCMRAERIERRYEGVCPPSGGIVWLAANGQRPDWSGRRDSKGRRDGAHRTFVGGRRFQREHRAGNGAEGATADYLPAFQSDSRDPKRRPRTCCNGPRGGPWWRPARRSIRSPSTSRTIRTAQCNNVYIFPAMGLGVVASGARRVNDAMILAAARALADHSPILKDRDRPLLPALGDLRTDCRRNRDGDRHCGREIGSVRHGEPRTKSAVAWWPTQWRPAYPAVIGQ